LGKLSLYSTVTIISSATGPNISALIKVTISQDKGGLAVYRKKFNFADPLEAKARWCHKS